VRNERERSIGSGISHRRRGVSRLRSRLASTRFSLAAGSARVSDWVGHEGGHVDACWIGTDVNRRSISTSSGREGGVVSDILVMFFFNGNFNTLYDCLLAFCGDLLRTLERDKG